MSRLCSIRHGIPVTLHTPAAYVQCSVFDQSGDNQSVVLGVRYRTWWPCYGQFEVGWLQLFELWLSAGISSVAPLCVSRDRDICHVQLHPLFAPNWTMVALCMAHHQAPIYDNCTASITLDWDRHWECSAPAQCRACTRGQRSSFGGMRLKLSMH